MNNRPHKYLISGGGTGGHIFPAIAIAEAIRDKEPDAQFLFVGANGRMEMTKVPDAGYSITGLDISGISRSLNLKNLLFPFRLLKSLVKAGKIIRTFQPDIAIGTGGYASGPTLYMAARRRIPTLIQEQNAFPGITNKILARRADTICVSYDNMQKFFAEEKIVKTGNPIRKQLQSPVENKLEALHFFGLEKDKKTILVVGGSQGSMAINRTISENIVSIADKANLIWQTGENGYTDAIKVSEELSGSNVKVHKFIKRMDMAYGAADIIISRAGAIAISEIAVAGKCAIFIPLPTAAEDHQTKNAMSLQDQDAAICMAQKEMPQELLPMIVSLLENEQKVLELAGNIKSTGKPNAAESIANEVFTLLKKHS
ncbi:MAG: undecaprenyldiphospho-muramoylpentapeptide beta-N-acetylglucosaminyltransferase [Marinilabiliales bacterium]|nr:MAG: undecaprenyldiphospho-muramoylpentapeptide beta-N-acetylglucosaminyltransferase [Marinilabiliales bacterium]